MNSHAPSHSSIAWRALTIEGTCTGKHGIGQRKKRYLEPEHGSAVVGAMRAIKLALDPMGTMARSCS